MGVSARGLRYLHPDHPLDVALRHAYDWPVLPVIHRADFGQLLAIVSLNNIVRVYRSSTGDGEHPDTVQTIDEAVANREPAGHDAE